MADDAEDFTLTYEKGGETYLLTDCGIAEDKAKIVASLDGANQVISDFFAGGTAVALGAQKVLNYLGQIGPSRSSGYADELDLWEDSVTIGNLARTAYGG